MNYAAPAFGAFASPGSRQRRKRIVVGIAVSLAIHALLLLAWRASLAPARVEQAPAPRSIAVWLRPPPAVQRVEEPQQRAAGKRGQPERAAAPRRERRVIAVPPTLQTAPQAEPFVVAPAPPDAPEPGTPRFDPEAARQMARQLASMRDPERAATAVGQLPEKPLETESRAARAIGAAKRRDCKDGLPGGLLGPLIILMDKKDSGCKW